MLFSQKKAFVFVSSFIFPLFLLLASNSPFLLTFSSSAKEVPTLTMKQVREKIKKGIIHGGMIPKVKACKYAVERGCKKAHLINGHITHALLLEIFTDKGVGTEIIR